MSHFSKTLYSTPVTTHLKQQYYQVLFKILLIFCSFSSAIPEEIYSKSLPEREKRGRAASLLPKLTPTAQIRSRMLTPSLQTTSLLSASSTDSENDEFHDGYDDLATPHNIYPNGKKYDDDDDENETDPEGASNSCRMVNI